jgi:dihydrofolate reductase
MRKLIICNIMSLDGFYEGPGGNVMDLPMDATSDAYNLERMRAADTLLLGRTTFELFKSYWPSQVDNPEASADNREIAKVHLDIDQVVISDSLTDDDVVSWRDKTTIVRRADAIDRVSQLKQGDGGELLTFGSRQTWNPLLQAGVVDELHLTVGAKALAGGTPIFTEGVPELRLLEARRFAGSDNILLRYQPLV